MTPNHIPDFTPTLHIFAAWVFAVFAALALVSAVGILLWAFVTPQHLVDAAPVAIVVVVMLAAFVFIRD